MIQALSTPPACFSPKMNSQKLHVVGEYCNLSDNQIQSNR